MNFKFRSLFILLLLETQQIRISSSTAFPMGEESVKWCKNIPKEEKTDFQILSKFVGETATFYCPVPVEKDNDAAQLLWYHYHNDSDGPIWIMKSARRNITADGMQFMISDITVHDKGCYECQRTIRVNGIRNCSRVFRFLDVIERTSTDSIGITAILNNQTSSEEANFTAVSLYQENNSDYFWPQTAVLSILIAVFVLLDILLACIVYKKYRDGVRNNDGGSTIENATLAIARNNKTAYNAFPQPSHLNTPRTNPYYSSSQSAIDLSAVSSVHPLKRELYSPFDGFIVDSHLPTIHEVSHSQLNESQ